MIFENLEYQQETKNIKIKYFNGSSETLRKVTNVKKFNNFYLPEHNQC